jgi:hypothetical protein
MAAGVMELEDGAETEITYFRSSGKSVLQHVSGQRIDREAPAVQSKRFQNRIFVSARGQNDTFPVLRKTSGWIVRTVDWLTNSSRNIVEAVPLTI